MANIPIPLYKIIPIMKYKSKLYKMCIVSADKGTVDLILTIKCMLEEYGVNEGSYWYP